MKNLMVGFAFFILVLSGCNKTATDTFPVPSEEGIRGKALGGLSGASSSGGVDNPKKESGSAWFLQDMHEDKSIQYCLKGYPKKFGGEAAIDAALVAAFQKWQPYAQRVEYANIRFIFKLNKLCDGNEQLTVYLGETNTEIENAKSKHENPTALVERLAYDPSTRLGKGFMWLALPGSVDPQKNYPDWTPTVLGGVVLHEVGHILGIPNHIEGTIMGDLRPWLMSHSSLHWLGEQAYYLSHIDHERQIILCPGYSPRCATEEYKLKGKGVFWAEMRRFEAGFKKLMGRDLEGEVTASLILDHDNGGPGGKSRPLVTLTMGDEKTKPLTFPVLMGDSECAPTDAVAFKREMEGHGNLGIQPTECRVYGTLTTQTGASLEIFILFNGSNFRARMGFVEKGVKYPLFVAFERDKVR